MNIYLKLFLVFLEIGAVSFGGGYGMISLVREKMLINGWLSENEVLNMIAVAESTPGPIAVNMASFVGSNQGGILGSLCATLGVVLPSFLIILIICAVLKNLIRYKPVKDFLSGVRPCVIGLILAVAITMFISKVFGTTSIKDITMVDIKIFIIFGIIMLISFLWTKIMKNKISPVLLIAFSAVLGLIFYS